MTSVPLQTRRSFHLYNRLLRRGRNIRAIGSSDVCIYGLYTKLDTQNGKSGCRDDAAGFACAAKLFHSYVCTGTILFRESSGIVFLCGDFCRGVLSVHKMAAERKNHSCRSLQYGKHTPARVPRGVNIRGKVLPHRLPAPSLLYCTYTRFFFFGESECKGFE